MLGLTIWYLHDGRPPFFKMTAPCFSVRETVRKRLTAIVASCWIMVFLRLGKALISMKPRFLCFGLPNPAGVVSITTQSSEKQRTAGPTDCEEGILRSVADWESSLSAGLRKKHGFHCQKRAMFRMIQPSRIVLSRKGFDSSAGGIPSPIFEDGTILSLPIPDASGTVRYDELEYVGHAYDKLAVDLHAKRIRRSRGANPLLATDRAHLDPDLIADLRPRHPGWRPIFGQRGKDATILRNHGVGPGDLFLFFGWFRKCAIKAGRYRFVSGAPDLHVLFGYLRIGEVIRPANDPVPRWVSTHPHLCGEMRNDSRNTLFVAAEEVGLPGLDGVPGAGSFSRFAPELQLTATAMSRSCWKLPRWFHPRGGAQPLSSHDRPDRWRMVDDFCLLQSVARGQEFILDVTQYPEAAAWATHIIKSGTRIGR